MLGGAGNTELEEGEKPTASSLAAAQLEAGELGEISPADKKLLSRQSNPEDVEMKSDMIPSQEDHTKNEDSEDQDDDSDPNDEDNEDNESNVSSGHINRFGVGKQPGSLLGAGSIAEISMLTKDDTTGLALINDTDVKRIFAVSKSRGNFAALLVQQMYGRHERIMSNVMGTRGKRQLSPRRMIVVKRLAFKMYPPPSEREEEIIWKKECVKAIDSKNRKDRLNNVNIHTIFISLSCLYEN